MNCMVYCIEVLIVVIVPNKIGIKLSAITAVFAWSLHFERLDVFLKTIITINIRNVF